MQNIFDTLKEVIYNNSIDHLFISETKAEDSFPAAQFDSILYSFLLPSREKL